MIILAFYLRIEIRQCFAGDRQPDAYHPESCGSKDPPPVFDLGTVLIILHPVKDYKSGSNILRIFCMISIA